MTDMTVTGWNIAMIDQARRLIPSSTSARFVERILSPYGTLDDLEYVSYDYPSDRVLAEHPELNRINVLEHVRDRFRRMVTDPTAREAMERVFDAYRALEGRNFNASDHYRQTWGVGEGPYRTLDEAHQPISPYEIMPGTICTTYFHADGTPSNAYVTFSIGGIHGAEYNQALYEADRAAATARAAGFEKVHGEWVAKVAERDVFNKALAQARTSYDSAARLLESGVDGIRVGDVFVPSGALVTATGKSWRRAYGMKGLLAREPRRRDVDDVRLFTDNGKLASRYAITSIGRMIHEDFSSYYPSMLRNMSAYYNADLGADPYVAIYEDKEHCARLARRFPERKAYYMSRRGGDKLLLNSATGASDTKPSADGMRDNAKAITMNNRILSMRLIGQMFTWLIGEEQTVAGATITSTNTDGLYSSLADEVLNDAILERASAPINVLIEPEPLLLASKDSNNRAEFDWVALDERAGMRAADLKVASVSGGSLAAAFGPDITKSLAHPAVTDYVTLQFLGECVLGNMSIDEPVPIGYCRGIVDSVWRCDDAFVRSFVNAGRPAPGAFEALNMFAQVLAASAGSWTYPFGLARGDGAGADDVVPFTHYNRIFMVREGLEGMADRSGRPLATLLRIAAGRKVTPAMRKRLSADELPVSSLDDPVALAALARQRIVRSVGVATGVKPLPADRYAAVVKVSGVATGQWVMRINDWLHCIVDDPRRQRALFDWLDRDAYAEAAKASIDNNWVNMACVEAG